MNNNELTSILNKENEKFQEYYHWLYRVMPAQLFHEIDQRTLLLIVHHLMNLDVQEYPVNIHLKHLVIVMSLEQPDADIQVLKDYATVAVKSYQTYLSKEPISRDEHLRIVLIHRFTEEKEFTEDVEEYQNLFNVVKYRFPMISDIDIVKAIHGISPPFLRSLSLEQLAVAIAMYIRALTRDRCQYEVKYNEEWESQNQPSMNITLAWRNPPKHNFLYRLVRIVYRHGLVVKQMSASYNRPYEPNSILVLSLDLHGKNNKAAWEVANVIEFIKELITVKYFASFDPIDFYLVNKGVINGNMAQFLRSLMNFVHQALLHIDVNLYSLEHIEEGLCRHPELTAQLCEAFYYKFHPINCDLIKYEAIKNKCLENIDKLDTGHEENDVRRKNILRQGLNFIEYTLKTNFYRPNYTSLGFRIDPRYMEQIPFDVSKKFPEIPFAIFFVKGMHFFGFHIRFRDLARGGIRTVFPEHTERMILERNGIFTECYNLALTQNMKNKDIPEGGAKGIIFLKPNERLDSEAAILSKELHSFKMKPNEIEKKIEQFRQEQRTENLYQAQRSFIETLVALINCDENGQLKTKDIVDYWKRPEYLYLGPDENMHDVMIQWIAEYSKKAKYKPGGSFISGKMDVGINHKEYGVTSLGVNVYMDFVLRYLGINPTKAPFKVKMSGGPDGDVAGNQICNLYNLYPNTAKLVALTDISGTIFDPEGLDLAELVSLFKQVKSIRYYPYKKLNPGGFLVDKFTKRSPTHLVQQTLCWRNNKGVLEEDWLSGSDMNFLLRHNVHQTPADIFIPCGGRPRTLNDTSWKEFLDPTGAPTAKAIIEGANLYLTPKARRSLEELGVLVVKDSSANKTGVICSSFEVLSGLALGDEKFIENKSQLIKEIRDRLRVCAANEANLLLRTHKETGEFLTDISDKISKRINQFTDDLLKYLERVPLSNRIDDPLIQSYLNYCLPILREQYVKELLLEIPDIHKKAIISCHIAAQLVYSKGLSWFPSIVDILPMLIVQKEPS